MNKNTVLLELLREINQESEAKDVMRACKIAASTIDAMQAQVEADKWISVEDRLPEKQINVLIFVVTGYKLRGSIVARYIPKTTEPYEGEYSEFGDYDEETDTTYCPAGWYAETTYIGDDYSSYFVDDKVTHWQPLPEPPTAQEGE